MNTNMNTSEFLRAVDHAAAMNDRWLFLAAFLLLIAGCGVVIYWLVKQLQSLISDHRLLRESHHNALAQIIEKQNETSLNLAICIDRNSEALRECAFELRRFQERKEA
jgi:predicted PurR-regulated permease PerM